MRRPVLTRGDGPGTWLSRLIERPSPIAKQLPTVLLLVVGVVLVAAFDTIDFTSVAEATIGISGVVVATVLAGFLTVRGMWDGWVVLLVPMIDVIALGFFRVGTGGIASLFGGFVLVPVVWLASAPRRRYIAVAVVLAAVAQLLPLFAEPPSSGEQWLRGVITPLVYAIVAVVVNELARLQRERTELAERLAEDRAAALRESSAALEQLRASEQRYRQLLVEFQSVWDATTAQAVISTDLDGTVVRWNPGAVQLFGGDETEVAGRLRVDALCPAATLELLAEGGTHETADPLAIGVRRLFLAADAGERVERELDLLGRGATIMPMRLTVTPRRDALGAQLGYLLVVSDETRAAEVARLKDEFVGTVSHELRTPLTSILGYVELLTDGEDEHLDAEQRQFLAVIERNARRLAKLVGDLLFTAKAEAGQFPLELRETDIVPVVLQAVESARPIAQQAGIELAVVAAAVPPMRLDPERIGQTVDNLLTNALKFTPRGGRVTVHVEAEADAVVVTVADTGHGIPQEELERIFGRFVRAPSAMRDMVPGVGLGLAISRAIVLAHGGTITVRSEAGVGTEFAVRIPLAASP